MTSAHRSKAALSALALLALLGTSKPLAYKRGTGKLAKTAAGLTAKQGPSFFVGENVNNQGCFVEQRLDLRVEVALKNAGKEAVTLAEKDATLTVGKQRFPIKRQYWSGAKHSRRHKALRTFTLPPGQTTTVRLEAYSFVAISKLPWKQIDRVEVSWPLGAKRGALKLRIDGLKALPLRKR